MKTNNETYNRVYDAVVDYIANNCTLRDVANAAGVDETALSDSQVLYDYDNWYNNDYQVDDDGPTAEQEAEDKQMCDACVKTILALRRTHPRRHTMLEMATIAKDYYNNCIPRRTYGMEKVIATDGVNTMFVNSDYEPQDGEVVYKVKRVYNREDDGALWCQLYKPRNNNNEKEG